jgi:50S ribosomal protein L16 3-hydroxylase
MTMPVDDPAPLLGGLSPAAFMRRHWQKKPLLVRQALPGVTPPLARAALFALASRDDVESRLVVRQGERWTLRHGPLPRRALPPLAQRGWTLLVQGLDTQVEAASALLRRFRFVPQARLDDVMISYASDGGGVGPHVDSYDVFLVQVHGRRRWRWGRVSDPSLVPGVPLKILRHFEPEHDAVLEPGDLLYLPPAWGHDGVAIGECMTCSVGFRAPRDGEIARELLQRLVDGHDADGGALYRDASQPATATPGAIPPALAAFAAAAVQRLLRDPAALEEALGEWLSEPKPQVWFEPGGAWAAPQGLVLDRRTRMLYDRRAVYLNGEAFLAGGRDARLLRALADRGALSGAEAARLSDGARAIVAEWVAAGWLHATDPEEPRR